MSLTVFLVGSFMSEGVRLTTSETHKWPLLHQVLNDKQLDCMPTQKHGDLSCIQYWMTEGLSPCHTVTFFAWSTGWQRVWVHAEAKAWWPKLLTPSNGWLRPGCKNGGLSCNEYWMTESSSPCQGKSLVANVTYTQKRTTQARMQARRPFLRRVLEVRGLDRHAHSTTPSRSSKLGHGLLVKARPKAVYLDVWSMPSMPYHELHGCLDGLVQG